MKELLSVYIYITTNVNEILFFCVCGYSAKKFICSD